MAKTAKPWERQKGETEKQFAGFCAYRDAGSGRQIAAVYRQVYSKPNAKQAAGFFSKWAIGNNWDERAAAYDDHMESVLQLQREKALGGKALEWLERMDAHREKMFETIDRLMARAEQMLATPLFDTKIVKTDAGEQIHMYPNDNWAPRDVTKYLTTADALMRISAMAPTQIIEHRYTVDWDSLTEEQEDRIADGENPYDVAPEHVEIH